MWAWWNFPIVDIGGVLPSLVVSPNGNLCVLRLGASYFNWLWWNVNVEVLMNWWIHTELPRSRRSKLCARTTEHTVIEREAAQNRESPLQAPLYISNRHEWGNRSLRCPLGTDLRYLSR